jgi:hypothetical protein
MGPKMQPSKPPPFKRNSVELSAAEVAVTGYRKAWVTRPAHLVRSGDTLMGRGVVDWAAASNTVVVHLTNGVDLSFLLNEQVQVFTSVKVEDGER